MPRPMADNEYINFIVPSSDGKSVDIVKAGFEFFPKAVLVPKNRTRVVKNLGLPKKNTWGGGIWVMVSDLMEEVDLMVRTSSTR